MSHLPQESFQITFMVPLLQRSAIFLLNLGSIRQNHFLQGRTNQGRNITLFLQRGAYYSIEHTIEKGALTEGGRYTKKPEYNTFSNKVNRIMALMYSH